MGYCLSLGGHDSCRSPIDDHAPSLLLQYQHTQFKPSEVGTRFHPTHTLTETDHKPGTHTREQQPTTAHPPGLQHRPRVLHISRVSQHLRLRHSGEQPLAQHLARQLASLEML